MSHLVQHILIGLFTLACGGVVVRMAWMSLRGKRACCAKGCGPGPVKAPVVIQARIIRKNKPNEVSTTP